jgi:hypothetical protein
VFEKDLTGLLVVDPYNDFISEGGILYPRSPQVPGLHPSPEAPPAHQPALEHGHMGFLAAFIGIAAPGHDPDVGSRPAGGADVHRNARY